MNQQVLFIALQKDGETFVFTFARQSLSALFHTFGRFAADPELNFTWFDAAQLSDRARVLAATETIG